MNETKSQLEERLHGFEDKLTWATGEVRNMEAAIRTKEGELTDLKYQLSSLKQDVQSITREIQIVKCAIWSAS